MYVILCINIAKVATERKETKHIEYLQALGVSLIVLGYFLYNPVPSHDPVDIDRGIDLRLHKVEEFLLQNGGRNVARLVETRSDGSMRNQQIMSLNLFLF